MHLPWSFIKGHGRRPAVATLPEDRDAYDAHLSVDFHRDYELPAKMKFLCSNPHSRSRVNLSGAGTLYIDWTEAEPQLHLRLTSGLQSSLKNRCWLPPRTLSPFFSAYSRKRFKVKLGGIKYHCVTGTALESRKDELFFNKFLWETFKI